MFSATKIIPTLAVVFLTAHATAQQATIHYSNSYSRNYGNSTAGASLSASASAYANKKHTTVWWGSTKISSYVGEGRGSANARLSAKFLGTSREVAYFSGRLTAKGRFTFFSNASWPNIQCSESGSVYLRLAGKTLWNSNFEDKLRLNRALSLRVATPTLAFIIGATPVTFRGALNGAINTAVDMRIMGCFFNANLDATGHATASGSASMTIWGPIIGGATAYLTVNRQTIDVDVNVQPPLSNTWTSPSTWIRGKAVYKRGSIRAKVRGWVYVPFKIPATLAEWSVGTHQKTLWQN